MKRAYLLAAAGAAFTTAVGLALYADHMENRIAENEKHSACIPERNGGMLTYTFGRARFTFPENIIIDGYAQSGNGDAIVLADGDCYYIPKASGRLNVEKPPESVIINGVNYPRPRQ